MDHFSYDEIVAACLLSLMGGWREGGSVCVCSVRSPGVWFSFVLLSLIPCDDVFSHMVFAHLLAFETVKAELNQLHF